MRAVTETLELSESSREEQKRHEDLMRYLFFPLSHMSGPPALFIIRFLCFLTYSQVEAKRKARTVTVPTSDAAVRRRLRELSHPITLFGELAPQRRERLREVLALHAAQSTTLDEADKKAALESLQQDAKTSAEFEEGGAKAQGPFAVPGSEALKQARIEILHYSLPRAKARLAQQSKKAELSECLCFRLCYALLFALSVRGFAHPFFLLVLRARVVR
jgi:hypothetical protein